MIANLLRTGDLVRINPKSKYCNHSSQLPEGTIGTITEVREYHLIQKIHHYRVVWDGRSNTYNDEDLVQVGFKAYLKRL